MSTEKKTLTIGDVIDTDEFVDIVFERVEGLLKGLPLRHLRKRLTLDRLFDKHVFATRDDFRHEAKSVLEGTSKLSSHERRLVQQLCFDAFVQIWQKQK